MKIRDLNLANKVIVAPMAGITNLAFRKLLTRYQPGLYFNEMISDMALIYDNQRTWEMTHILENEQPIAFQLFGSKVETMVQAAQLLDQKTDCAIIDINMGCPVHKITKQGAGSALMKSPELAYDLMKNVVQAVKKPVTMKMRIGWDQDHLNGVEIAQLAEKAGIETIYVHGRTRAQMYSGTSNNEKIKEIVDSVRIPVVGNGDIRSAEDALTMVEETGCAAVMVGRALLNQPWLIQEIKDGFDGKETDLSLSIPQRLAFTLEHAQELIKQMGEHHGMRQMRSHALWAFKGLPHSHTIKAQVNQIAKYQDLELIINEYLEAFYSH